MLEITPTDMQRYRALVSSIGVSDDAKDEVIRVVRSMMQDFVDRAFGDHPVQLIQSTLKASLESTESAKLAFNKGLQMKHAGLGVDPSPLNADNMRDGEN